MPAQSLASPNFFLAEIEINRAPRTTSIAAARTQEPRARAAPVVRL
jgi:hypothetical protein